MIVNENLAIQVGLVQTKDFGSYTCIASNQWGKTRHQVIILYIFLSEPPWYCNGKLLVIIIIIIRCCLVLPADQIHLRECRFTVTFSTIIPVKSPTSSPSAWLWPSWSSLTKGCGGHLQLGHSALEARLQWRLPSGQYRSSERWWWWWWWWWSWWWQQCNGNMFSISAFACRGHQPPATSL